MFLSPFTGGSRPVDPGGRLSRLLDVQSLASVLACSRRTIYRLISSGTLPRPLKVGRLCRWREEDIDAWLSRPSGRDRA